MTPPPPLPFQYGTCRWAVPRGWWTQPRLDVVPDHLGWGLPQGASQDTAPNPGQPKCFPSKRGTQVRNGSRVSTVNVERERKLLPNDGEDTMVVTQERNPQHGRGHAGRATGKAGRVDRGRRCGSGTALPHPRGHAPGARARPAALQRVGAQASTVRACARARWANAANLEQRPQSTRKKREGGPKV